MALDPYPLRCVRNKMNGPYNWKCYTAFMVSGTYQRRIQSVPCVCVCGLKVLYFTRMLAYVARYAPIILAGGA